MADEKLLDTVENLKELVRIYQKAKDDEFALFLGSGVNGGTWAKEHLACSSWPELLRALDNHFHLKPRLKNNLEDRKENWIQIAENLLGDKNREEKVQAIDEEIYKGVFRNPTNRSKQKRTIKTCPQI